MKFFNLLMLGIVILGAFAAGGAGQKAPAEEARFDGAYFAGNGDAEFFRLLDFSRTLYEPNPALPSISMLYTDRWNGFVEGPTWGAWWVQNSYGTSWTELPFLEEPYITFLDNADDLWYRMMGDGVRTGMHGWQAPDGQLCDCASPETVVFKQGDGRIDLHDWGIEFTAAGTLITAESLLISRNREKIEHYLPYFRRSADFIETRRDPKNNLYLAGPAANLLAPSYAGWKIDDNTYRPAYLTGLSITWIAALDRLIELEKMAGTSERVELYTKQRQLAQEGLKQLVTGEGYYIKYFDPDGTRHGVYGAPEHGYFEAVCNHDAVALRVADEEQSKKIVDKIRSIPGLRPHDLILTNYPALDDLYVKEPNLGLFEFGRWVDGGHWTTCEARMMMAYYRTGCFDDIVRSMHRIEALARPFRMDNPLSDCGNALYQPDEPINCCYDTWGAPAAMIRGLFEYIYSAENLTLYPHIPGTISELVQKFPIRFGEKRIYLSTSGNGPVEAVFINGRPWDRFDADSVTLPYDALADRAAVRIVMTGGDAAFSESASNQDASINGVSANGIGTGGASASQKSYEYDEARFPSVEGISVSPKVIARFYGLMADAGLAETYEARHARLILDSLAAWSERQQELADGTLAPLPEPSQKAADAVYVSTIVKLTAGLAQTLSAYKDSPPSPQSAAAGLWQSAQQEN